MTEVDVELPEALRRALPLLREPPAFPDARHGYLDLLEAEHVQSAGRVQSLWLSAAGSAVYDRLQAVARRARTPFRPPDRVMDLAQGSRALDIGCGPGNITAALGRAVGSDGLALGLDVSEPMLARAVGSASVANVGFLRADARDLPFSEASFDAATCLAALQLMPDPFTVLEQLGRALVPGGWATVLVPTVSPAVLAAVSTPLGRLAGVTMFAPEDIPDAFDSHGFDRIHSSRIGSMQWVRARKKE